MSAVVEQHDLDDAEAGDGERRAGRIDERGDGEVAEAERIDRQGDADDHAAEGVGDGPQRRDAAVGRARRRHGGDPGDERLQTAGRRGRHVGAGVDPGNVNVHATVPLQNRGRAVA